MAVRSRSVLKRSLLKRLVLPTETSNRLRGEMRGGLWSSSSVPGAGIWTSFEEYCEAGQDVNPDVGVAVTPLQVIPASNSSSSVRPLRSTPWPLPGRVIDVAAQGLFGSVPP